ncbi:MAG: D-glycero-beta-D-manno-heptose 1-phosphate adenylyltransferase [Crocinitomicaceae bacterium]|nr:D-glycero-beta-D-manno-heptose 1-phosphate adenylyltransferase [Crocinitomicaceae bacterium]|tara:strand:+ start:3474 stop:3941 length:468 start_codon:yes stop_codon:yes gene_type:complete
MDFLGSIESWRNDGHKIVFTNGVFDILHVGHLYCLESAKALGSKLVVAINDDDSVRRLNKAPKRPINSERDRAQLLSGLECVDLVIIFSEDTPLSTIEAVQPNVLVKGDDYDASCTDPLDPKYIVGSNEVKKNGGEVQTVPLLLGHSTTNILNSR